MSGVARSGSDAARSLRLICAALPVLLALGSGPFARAGGPRFVTGSTYTGAPAGQIIGFYTMQPLYYTDPGDLSATVTHAQADAMVAAAANVWNAPTSLLTLAQGGTLDEHVSGANSYFDGDGVVYPADVQASNYVAKPIAVIYDTDGSMTDLLLGSGASDPEGCRQNGVTESVDAFGETGTIEHAMILLNGRCVGSAPEQMLQMQYQLMRAFGRVIGLAWSQLNDNVFTGVSPVTSGQATYWPVMHPIDVICGPYTYQCMQEPFTLRPDDLSALALLYPVTASNVTPGKTISNVGAVSIVEYLTFPTGQGMEMVNLTVSRKPANQPVEDFQIASGVSGALYQEDGGNPVTERTVPAADNVGRFYPDLERETMIARVPLAGTEYYNLPITTETIDPLYTGDYAIAPYDGEPLALPGPPVTDNLFWGAVGNFSFLDGLVVAGAPSSCNPGNDGVEKSPVAADPSGWWTGLLCGPGHVSWWSASVKAGRSWTLEVTALDEAGAASAVKLRPMIGVWNASDPTGTLPTVAATPAPMNSISVGMTQLPVAAASANSTVRIAVADEFGAGRPDLTYSARMLYADSIAPAVVGSGGGRITINGTGFRQGNVVTVNGVKATVVSWTATQIVASAPPMAAAGMSVGALADVAVIDEGTAGQTVMSAALGYSAAIDTIQVVSAPAALDTGMVAATPFAVRLFASDGVTPVAGASVQFTVVSGGATLSGCGSDASCVMTTDATGLAQTVVTGTSVGTVVLKATEMSGGATVSVTLQDASPVWAVTAPGPPRYLAAGAAVSWSDSVVVTLDGVAATGVGVMWSATGGLALGASQGLTDATGTASVTVQTSGLAGGAEGIVAGCLATTTCASSTAYGVAAPLWTIGVSSGAGQEVASTAVLGPVVLLVTDDAGHPLQGAPVQVYQTVEAWEGACPAQGRCPAAPVLAAAQSAGTTDGDGLLTVTPLQVPGVPQVVNLAASTGTQGFVALTLTKMP